jgi:uncharacterized membrane protein
MLAQFIIFIIAAIIAMFYKKCKYFLLANSLTSSYLFEPSYKILRNLGYIPLAVNVLPNISGPSMPELPP